MHPGLLDSLERLKAHFAEDCRCLGMYSWGSFGTSHADAYSDIDVAVVIVDDAYRDVKRELPGICEDIFGNLVAWLPEGESDNLVNYAFLFPYRDDLLLYDLKLVTASWAA